VGARGRGGGPRARSHCRFALPLIRFIPYPRTYSVPLFLKRQCDRTPGGPGGVPRRLGDRCGPELAGAPRQLDGESPWRRSHSPAYLSFPYGF
jgi:hypothetical protein